jgi:protein N-lysine methyltransferase METTL21A
MSLDQHDRTYRRLLARIRRLVPIEETSTTIAGQPIPWIRVTDPDRLLLTALEQGLDGSFDQDPFWAAAWRAAEGMQMFLQSISSQLRGQSVLELGGGSGRAGIAAGLLDADVTITDASRTAILVCRYNAFPVRKQVRVTRLDWRDTCERLGRFPIILGSDIVYDPKLFPLLEPCLRRHLQPGGIAYFSEPQRHTGDRFRHWIQTAGWILSEHYVDLGDGEKEIRIFECRC